MDFSLRRTQYSQLNVAEDAYGCVGGLIITQLHVALIKRCIFTIAGDPNLIKFICIFLMLMKNAIASVEPARSTGALIHFPLAT